MKIDSSRLDHFSQEGENVFAGTHIIVDFWGASNLDDTLLMSDAFNKAVKEAKAHLLHMHLHPFEGGGITGVAALSESHISVHTWPELGYAAFDVFMCGDSEPEKAVNILKDTFKPKEVSVQTIKRGLRSVKSLERVINDKF